MATTPADRIEQRLLRIHRDLLDLTERTITTMGIIEDLNAKLDLLQASLVDAKADAARQTALAQQGVQTMQDMKAALDDLRNNQGIPPDVQTQLEALSGKLDASITTAEEANATRDAADASLQAGIAGVAPPAP